MEKIRDHCSGSSERLSGGILELDSKISEMPLFLSLGLRKVDSQKCRGS
jgi:hypothetical protein